MTPLVSWLVIIAVVGAYVGFAMLVGTVIDWGTRQEPTGRVVKFEKRAS